MNINIPSSLHEVTLGQYQHYVKVVRANSDEEGNIKEDKRDLVNQKCVEIFCDLEGEEYRQLPMTVAETIVGQITKIFKDDTPLYKRVTLLDGKKKIKLGFIPDLEEISIGEYIDLENTLWEVETLHQAMAVLYRPVTMSIGHRYEIAKYTADQQYVTLMKAMPLSAALGAQVFFYNLGNELLNDITLSLLEDQKQILSAKTLEKSGDGIATSTP